MVVAAPDRFAGGPRDRAVYVRLMQLTDEQAMVKMAYRLYHHPLHSLAPEAYIARMLLHFSLADKR